jgi:hypothetical protein
MGQLRPVLIRFIDRCIPTYHAAEVLLFLATNPDRRFAVEEISAAMRPTGIAASEIKDYLDRFTAGGFVTEDNGRFGYVQATGDLEGAVCELVRAYNEQPVTLIATIYRLADRYRQSLSRSFIEIEH